VVTLEETFFAIFRLRVTTICARSMHLISGVWECC